MPINLYRSQVIKALKFAVTGAANFVLELGVFNLVLIALPTYVIGAKVISVVVATISSYFMSRYWVFDNHGSHREQAIKFFGSNLILLVVSALLLNGLTHWHLAMSSLTTMLTEQQALNVMNLVSILAVVILRFTVYEKLVFTSSKAINLVTEN